MEGESEMEGVRDRGRKMEGWSEEKEKYREREKQNTFGGGSFRLPDIFCVLYCKSIHILSLVTIYFENETFRYVLVASHR